MTGSDIDTQLAFVAAVNNRDVLRRRLLASECLRTARWPLRLHERCASAAQAFNAEVHGKLAGQWLVWVHQDVHLPSDWDQRFRRQLTIACERWDRLAIVGVYGVRRGEHVGHVRWSGRVMRPAGPLPSLVESLDELIFAVRRSSGLLLDASLGFDFYGTDLVLQARELGFDAAVVDAPCEHWTIEPLDAPPSAATVQRVLASAQAFERKWAHRLPITTPCVVIERAGDTLQHVRKMGWVSS